MRTTVRVRDAEEGGAALAALLGTTLEHDLAGPFLRIGWTVVRPVASTGDGVDHLAILVPGDAYEAARDWIGTRAPLLPGPSGIDVAGPAGWESLSVYFDGPAVDGQGGVVLELIAHAGHRDATAGRPAELLGVCEVGVAVPDVEGAIVASGLPVFADTASPDFAAVGDRDGRIILASPGRTWFPTADRVAGAGPVVITAEGVDREVRLGEAHLLPA